MAKKKRAKRPPKKTKLPSSALRGKTVAHLRQAAALRRGRTR